MRYTLLCLLFAAPAHADCGPDQPGADSAAEAVRAFGALLDGEPDLPRVQAGFATLLAHRCVESPITRGIAPDEPDSVTAMRAWWADGGEAWIDLLRARRGPEAEQAVPFPPMMRKTLATDVTPSHAARAILCPTADPGCGAGTRGWVARVEAQAQKAWGQAPDAAALAKCEAAAREAGDDPFQAWATCVDAARPQALHLPVGQFKAPDRGWLLVRGRRGHYSFCDGARLYHLPSGSMFVSESCSRLALLQGGKVDHDQTNAGRDPGQRAGSVPADNLREALWMMLLADAAENGPVGSAKVKPPAWLKPKARSSTHYGLGRSFWMSSNQTRLSWVWFDGDEVLADGTLTWPDSSALGQAHAAHLLRVAEAGFTPGCPAAQVPNDIPLGPRPAVSSVDARPADVTAALARMVSGLGAARQGACAHEAPAR